MTSVERPCIPLTVTGITCGHCEKAVRRAIAQLDSAAHVDIDRAANRVSVWTSIPEAAIRQAIAAEGYTVAD